jgi:2,4-dienoyl-CoA reductase-like NADH-dependent reductase (Old Yellow Enzyme family)/thioredoxin reductase
MSKLKYQHLFEPIQLGRTLFRNRIFSSPQDFPGLTSDRLLTKDAIAFYESKAQGGFASVCIGDFMVDSRAGHSHPFQLRGDDIKGKVCFTQAANAITRHGAVASVELNHAGKNANMMAGREGFIYGIVDEERPDGVEVRQMDEEWIERLINCFANGASFAKQCGFTMVTIHGGHGWLFSQFMSPRDNTRKDRWGGSFENRMRFPLAAIEAMRKKVGPGFPIEIRISGGEFMPDGYDIDYGIEIAKALDGKVDLIHVSAGHHEYDSASMITHPNMFMDDGCNVQLAAAIKKHVKTPVATVGALTDPELMEEIIASGQADIVQLGRQTLADPDLPLKARTGHEDDINKCMRCYNCFSYSTIGGVFYCATNPKTGNELECMFDTPPRKQKKVLVAGGGIGGMQAALTAAERGHQVILCEKSDKLGGVLHCEKNIPFKQKLDGYLKLQANRIAKAPIEVHLDTEVTPQVAASFNPDVIIAALGSRPVKPPVPGIDGSNVMGAEEVYYHPEKVGENVVIMGGGLVGLELGVYLAQTEHNVTVVEMLDKTCASPDFMATSERFFGFEGVVVGDPIVHGIAIREQLKNLPNMTIRTSTKVLEINDQGIKVEGPEGVRAIKADTVVYAVGQKPLREEAVKLHACAPEFYQIGDCVTPRNIFAATQAAWQIARDIGRI